MGHLRCSFTSKYGLSLEQESDMLPTRTCCSFKCRQLKVKVLTWYDYNIIHAFLGTFSCPAKYVSVLLQAAHLDPCFTVLSLIFACGYNSVSTEMRNLQSNLTDDSYCQTLFFFPQVLFESMLNRSTLGFKPF